jgi:hypothetical protein
MFVCARQSREVAIRRGLLYLRCLLLRPSIRIPVRGRLLAGSLVMKSETWPSYTNKQHHYSLRYPPDWVIHEERPESVSVRSPDCRIQLSVTLWRIDYPRMKEMFRGSGRSNVYLIREFTLRLGNQDTAAFEFRDTITRAKETRVLTPSPGGCYELRWRRTENSDSPELNSTFEAISSTFDLHSQ